jgi:hypothetical protein
MHWPTIVPMGTNARRTPGIGDCFISATPQACKSPAHRVGRALPASNNECAACNRSDTPGFLQWAIRTVRIVTTDTREGSRKAPFSRTEKTIAQRLSIGT